MSKLKDDLELAHSSNIFLDSRTIFINGEVSLEMYTEVVKNLHALDMNPEKPVTVYMNCEGGEVTQGFAIYDAIKAMKSYVRCYIFGECSSIATVILQAFDERILTPNSYLMVHEGKDSQVDASRTTQKRWQAFEENIMRKVEDIYLEKIKNNYKRYGRKRLQELLKHDTILTPTEAVKLGLADVISEGDI